jgi:uracil-DNA glycosylase
MNIPAHFLAALNCADVSWRPLLVQGLEAIMAATPDYLPQLAQDDYLPTGQRLFAAFALPLEQVRCAGGGGALSASRQCHRRLLHGWGGGQPVVGPAGGGLSKPVNKATSLRNFMKMLLVADGQLDLDDTGSEAMARIALRAQEGKGSHILTLAELQDKLMEQGFLLLNARWCSALTLRRLKMLKPGCRFSRR